MTWSSIGVPNVPGVSQGISGAIIKFGGAFAINRLLGDYWGIFDQNGIPLLLVDNVKTVRFSNKSNILSAPLEAGSFATYNKVMDPFTVTVEVTKSSGGVSERGAFLGLLEYFANSTDFFMVITPEAIYPNCNIVGYDYARVHNDGARMIKASIQLKEVREVEVEYTKTKADQSQIEKTSTNTQPTEASASEKSALLELYEWALE